MKAKRYSILIMALAIALILMLLFLRFRVDALITAQLGAKCVIGGKCVHNEYNGYFNVAIILAVAVLVVGLYMTFFERSQKAIREHQEELKSVLVDEKQLKNKDEKFSILLSGLDKEEQTVLKAVRSQEGIMQSTLKYRTGLSKTKLSMVLKGLERRGLVTREDNGRTKKVFLGKGTQ